MRAERPLVMSLLVILFCLLVGSTLRAQFHIVEDHSIFRAKGRPVLQQIYGDLTQQGRVRPMYFVLHRAKMAVLGTNPFAWHLVAISMGVVTCLFLYLTMRAAGADAAASFVFVLLVSAGLQSAIWYLLCGEILAVLLVSLSLWAMVCASQHSGPGWLDAGSLIAAGLAGLSKESFVLVMPALLALRVTLHCHFHRQGLKPALQTLRLPVLAGLLVFTLQLLTVALVTVMKPGTYGPGLVGLSWRSFSPRVWLQLSTSPGLAPVTSHLPLAALVLIIACWRPGRARHRPYFFAGLLILVLWTLPQLVLHSHGIIAHYLFPAIIAPAATVSIGLAVLWRAGGWVARTAWLGFALLLIPTLSQGIRVASEAADRFTAETVSVHRMVAFLAQNVPAERAIVTTADPGTGYGYQAAYALPVYLAAAGSASPVFLWPVVTQTGMRTPIHMAVAERTKTTFAPPEGLRAGDVGGIILVDMPSAVDAKPGWFSETAWRELTFAEPVHALVLRQLGYVKTDQVRSVALVRGMPASESPSDKPLVRVASTLSGSVGINPPLTTPPWGLERDSSGVILWLGDGATGEFGCHLWSEYDQAVELQFDVAPGPGRSDPARSVELARGAGSAPTERRHFDEASRIAFPFLLQRGGNFFRFRVLDKATITRQPNGDTRPLLVLVRRVDIKPRP